MHFRKTFLLPILLLVALTLVLGACQQVPPATESTPAPTEEKSPPTEAPEPTAQQQPESTPTQDGFQEVEASLDKTIFPPDAPEGFSPEERPDSTFGQDDATLTMYEWCDYAYPNCVTFYQETLPQLKEKYIDAGKLRIVHKEFPVAGGDPSVIASMGAQCAARQGQYAEMADWLYNNVQAWSQQTDIQAMKDAVKQGGEAIGIQDLDAFNACVDNEETLDLIKQDYFDGRDLEFRELPSFVVDGQLISEGISSKDLMTVIDALLHKKDTGSLPDTVVTVTPSPTPDTDFEDETVTVLGDPNAPVTIVEFSDYQCPYCLRHFQQTMPQLKKDYIDTGKVRYVFKDFPLTQIHPLAVPAAEAAECAGEQGKYWEMHDLLFGQQERWIQAAQPNDVFKEFAQEIGLDMNAFDECVQSGKYQDEITADMHEGLAAGVQGTPAFFINGQFLSGAQPYEVFKQMIDQILAANGQ